MAKKKKAQTNKKIVKQIIKFLCKSKILKRILKDTILVTGGYYIGRFGINECLAKKM